MTAVAVSANTCSQPAASQADTTSQARTTQPRTTYARSLSQGYAEGWEAAQQEKEARRIQLARTEEAIRNAQNTIVVIVWKEVRLLPAELYFVNFCTNLLLIYVFRRVLDQRFSMLSLVNLGF